MPEVNMPRLSDTMQEGTIARWLKKPGDQVQKGDTLAEVETDKATMDIEAYDAGVLEQIMVQEGQTAPIGQAIARIGSGAGVGAQNEPQPQAQQKPAATDGAPATADVEANASAPAEEATKKQTSGASSTSQPEGSAAPRDASQGNSHARPAEEDANGHGSGFIKASPLARRMAEEHQIDLSRVQGSGPGGRIVRDDVENFREKGQSPAEAAPSRSQPAEQREETAPAPSPTTLGEEGEVIALSRMQTIVARRLLEAKQTIPHFYVSNEVDMTDALALRQKFNESVGEDGTKVSVNDLIIKACALALEKFPEVNSSLRDGQFLRHKQIHVGFAVDVPAGLVVPVIRDANLKGVRTIAREAHAFIEKARANKLAPDEMTGSTFSISNLGMMDVTSFVAVINPPEAAILAIASTRKHFVPIDDQPVIREIMPMTLSADHRIIYGATVARFLQEIKRLLQNPYNLLG